MKTVDLNAILDKHTIGKINTWSAYIDAMKEACEQTVALCWENYLDNENGSVESTKRAILNTKNQIK